MKADEEEAYGGVDMSSGWSIFDRRLDGAEVKADEEEAYGGVDMSSGWSIFDRRLNPRLLFVVFEDQKNKNALTQETMRHRLAYVQAKNSKLQIVRRDLNSVVRVGRELYLTSDQPKFVVVDFQKGTFREHKGKMSQIDLDKFVRQVQSHKLNIVRKLSSQLKETKLRKLEP